MSENEYVTELENLIVDFWLLWPKGEDYKLPASFRVRAQEIHIRRIHEKQDADYAELREEL